MSAAALLLLPFHAHYSIAGGPDGLSFKFFPLICLATLPPALDYHLAQIRIELDNAPKLAALLALFLKSFELIFF